MELRELGTTGIRVSPLGLGTVKIGRYDVASGEWTFRKVPVTYLYA